MVLARLPSDCHVRFLLLVGFFQCPSTELPKAGEAGPPVRRRGAEMRARVGARLPEAVWSV